MARTQIYDRPDSVYLRLLKRAGCEFADFQTQVHRHGLEATLVKLAEEGVYLTSDEYKGKKDVVRGELSFRVSPGGLRAPVLIDRFFHHKQRYQKCTREHVQLAGLAHGKDIGDCDGLHRARCVFQVLRGLPAYFKRQGKSVLIRGKIGIATDWQYRELAACIRRCAPFDADV